MLFVLNIAWVLYILTGILNSFPKHSLDADRNFIYFGLLGYAYQANKTLVNGNPEKKLVFHTIKVIHILTESAICPKHRTVFICFDWNIELFS